MLNCNVVPSLHEKIVVSQLNITTNPANGSGMIVKIDGIMFIGINFLCRHVS